MIDDQCEFLDFLFAFILCLFHTVKAYAAQAPAQHLRVVRIRHVHTNVMYVQADKFIYLLCGVAKKSLI